MALLPPQVKTDENQTNTAKIRAKHQRMKPRFVPFEPCLMFHYDSPSSSSESDPDAPDESPMQCSINPPHNASDTNTDYYPFLDQTRIEPYVIEHNLD